GENLQTHDLYLSHSVMLALSKEADLSIELPFDSSRIQASYYTETGWESFSSVVSEGERLFLKKSSQAPSIAEREVDGKTARWLKFSLPEMKAAEALPASYPSLLVSGPVIEPDVVYGSDAELPIHRFLPFGERLDEFQEVYFGSEEVFSKKGAKIRFSFCVDFVQVPLETNEWDMIRWEWIMDRSEFPPVQEYDVTIASVVWEYFNGTGWTTLITDEDASRVFSYADGKKGEYVTISFDCPGDMTSVTVGAIDTFYIRARIRKVNNLFKLRGQYILPLLENVGLFYAYRAPLYAEQVLLHNNADWQEIRQGASPSFLPFVQMGQEHASMYLGFATSPAGYPVKWFIEIENEADRHTHLLDWEYWNGQKWEKLHPVDETAQLSRSGFLTLYIRSNIASRRLFGKERYWLRVSDVTGAYGPGQKHHPLLNHAFLNAVKVRQIDRREQEYFRMANIQKGASFKLLFSNIQDQEVYVEETGQLSEEDRRQLLETHRMVEESDGEEGKRCWVKWSPVEDFHDSDCLDRHYVLHRRTGELLYGDGVHGRIPEASVRQNILVRYTTGGGTAGNRAIGDLKQMERSIGFINVVTNPAILTGGCDVETLGEAVRRMTGTLRHQNRAVSLYDFEMLALEASRDIMQAKAFGGLDENGEPKSGQITLVLFNQTILEGQYHFTKTKSKILDFFRERINPITLGNKNFAVTGPELVEIAVCAEIVAKDYADIFTIHRKVEKRLEDFLKPKTRSGDTGWTIGSCPSLHQLENVILGVEGIRLIRHLTVNYFRYGGHELQNIQSMKRRPFILPVSGAHEIMVTME
ncbi:MAG: baseplate J/gp47 family protein, partial [Lachnospiraceae bacterium]|nr:baseplate J/gp47 family protein [Lachnospiraceae bacterium]